MENQQLRRTKTKTGVVVGNKMDKTASISVDRLILEPRFKKYVKRSKKFLAHDEKNECEVGDIVRIRETRPFSKRKSWKVIDIIKKAVGKGVGLKEGGSIPPIPGPLLQREKKRKKQKPLRK